MQHLQKPPSSRVLYSRVCVVKACKIAFLEGWLTALGTVSCQKGLKSEKNGGSAMASRDLRIVLLNRTLSRVNLTTFWCN